MTSISVTSYRSTAKDFFDLTKPRIVLMLLITCVCAMIVANRGVPSIPLLFWTLLGLGLSSGGANAVNMWYDRDIDQVMERTRKRPIPGGRMKARNALIFGILLQIVSFVLMAALVNWISAFLALAGFVYYVFVYTMLLKRSTPQNIVIGGGAGSFPPLVGWAAVTGGLGWAPILMFLIIFFWTPPHFWALALYKQDDYRRAGIPMMPVVRGERTTKWQSLGYDMLLLITSVLLYWTGVVGVWYLGVAILLGLVFIVLNSILLWEQAPSVIWAKRTFKFSLIYLTVLFAVMVLNIQ